MERWIRWSYDSSECVKDWHFSVATYLDTTDSGVEDVKRRTIA
jgi:hypothetical protein